MSKQLAADGYVIVAIHFVFLHCGQISLRMVALFQKFNGSLRLITAVTVNDLGIRGATISAFSSSKLSASFSPVLSMDIWIKFNAIFGKVLVLCEIDYKDGFMNGLIRRNFALNSCYSQKFCIFVLKQLLYSQKFCTFAVAF
jgi:hypothetical protein